jgi:probable HAF family extracellular repeat protein
MKKMMKRNTLKIVLAISLSGFVLSVNAASYKYTDLNKGSFGSQATAINASGQVTGVTWITSSRPFATLWSDATTNNLNTASYRSQAAAINTFGQVAGYSYNPGYYDHATLWNGTTITDLGTPGERSQAKAINDSGQIVGFIGNYATLWNDTTVTNLGVLEGGGISQANDINSSGQIVGFSWNSNSDYHATLWNGTTITDLGTLAGNPDSIMGSRSKANAINDSGQIVGWSSIPGYFGTSHATLWNGTTVTDLGTLSEGDRSQANDINAFGQIVGWSNTTGMNGAKRATLWNGTTITDLNIFLDASTLAAGWILQEATGINDNGWIVGNALHTFTGTSHAFLLSVSPVPEPETSAMMLVGLCIMGLVARRRKDEQA